MKNVNFLLILKSKVFIFKYIMAEGKMFLKYDNIRFDCAAVILKYDNIRFDCAAVTEI